MKEVDLKLIWHNAHKDNTNIMENFNTMRSLMQKSHAKVISKIMNDLKLKILIYSITLFSIIGTAIYGFVYLKLVFPLSGILPFILGGLFLAFKVISELARFLVLNSQNDNKSIKEATAFYRKKLKKIKTFDFGSYFVLCYSISGFFLFSYIFNMNGFKNFLEFSELSGLLTIFVVLLLIVPWITINIVNARYKKIDLNLKSAMDYFGE